MVKKKNKPVISEGKGSYQIYYPNVLCFGGFFLFFSPFLVFTSQISVLSSIVDPGESIPLVRNKADLNRTGKGQALSLQSSGFYTPFPPISPSGPASFKLLAFTVSSLKTVSNSVFKETKANKQNPETNSL